MDYLWLIFISLSLIKDEKHYILMAFKSMGTGGLWEPATSPKFGCSILPWILGGDFKSDHGYLGLPWGLFWWLSGKEPTCQCKRLKWVQSLGQEDPLEKGMEPHSSILGWRIPWTEEPGGLQSMGSQRGGHDWVTKHTKDSSVRDAQSWHLGLQTLS